MKALRYGTIAIAMATLVGVSTAQPPQQQPQQRPGQPQQQPAKQQRPQQPAKPTSAPMAAHDPATIRDIENTFGFVPQWLRATPVQLLPSFWQTLKSFQMSQETALNNKTKELIGLAVAAQIPCTYCVQFHTHAARMNGASDQEIREAVGMAAVTREASTILNGMMVDQAQFKRDTDRMMRGSKQQARK